MSYDKRTYNHWISPGLSRRHRAAHRVAHAGPDKTLQLQSSRASARILPPLPQRTAVDSRRNAMLQGPMASGTFRAAFGRSAVKRKNLQTVPSIPKQPRR